MATDPWGQPGDLGIPVLWDVSGSTGKLVGSPGDLRKRAESQIEAAKAGQGLASLRSEVHPNSFYTGASTDVLALYHVAYWLAVGSRLLVHQGKLRQAAELGKAAQSAVNKAYAISVVPFLTDKDPRKIQRIMHAGGRMAAEYNLGEVARVLGYTSTPASIQTAQTGRQDTELGPSLLVQGESARQGLEDIAVAGKERIDEVKGMLPGGKRPKHIDPTVWFFKKWGWRLALGSVGLIVLAVVLRPYATTAATLAEPRRPRRRRSTEGRG